MAVLFFKTETLGVVSNKSANFKVMHQLSEIYIDKRYTCIGRCYFLKAECIQATVIIQAEAFTFSGSYILQAFDSLFLITHKNDQEHTLLQA